MYNTKFIDVPMWVFDAYEIGKLRIPLFLFFMSKTDIEGESHVSLSEFYRFFNISRSRHGEGTDYTIMVAYEEYLDTGIFNEPYPRILTLLGYRTIDFNINQKYANQLEYGYARVYLDDIVKIRKMKTPGQKKTKASRINLINVMSYIRYHMGKRENGEAIDELPETAHIYRTKLAEEIGISYPALCTAIDVLEELGIFKIYHNQTEKYKVDHRYYFHSGGIIVANTKRYIKTQDGKYEEDPFYDAEKEIESTINLLKKQGKEFVCDDKQ